MSNYEIMTTDAAGLPATLFNAEIAALCNTEALAGTSGRVARITTNGKQFVLVDTAGVEKPLKPADLTPGEDGNLYLPIIVLRPKTGVTKAWYIKPFDQNAPPQPPDCFSNDGKTPDASIPTPQCSNCAQCPYNAWGSGKDAAGNATKGKACSDNKVLAVFCKGNVYELKIMPTALQDWDAFVRQASMIKGENNAPLPLAFIKILLGFKEGVKHQQYTFTYGGVIAENAVQKVVEMVRSPEVTEIIERKMTYTAPEQGTTPAPAAKPAAKPAAEKEEPADDLGLGVAAAPVKEAKKEGPAAPVVEISDAELAAELGL